jgi:hypothetical protein
MNAREWSRGLSLSLLLIVVTVTSRQANASSDSGTLTAGQLSSSCPPGIGTGILTYDGMGSEGSSYGSYNPYGLTGGDTVWSIFDIHKGTATCAGNASTLVVTGFSSNPGSSWLTSIKCNGVQNSGSTASYFYVSLSGNAVWQWSTLFGFANGSQYSCTIVHS